MDKKKDNLLDHDYDGIKELDNDLPPWWLWLFYISIGWSVLYMLYYHVLGIGPSSDQEYLAEMNPNMAVMAEAGGTSLLPVYHSPYYSPKGEVTPKVVSQFEEYIDAFLGVPTSQETYFWFL